jgi:dynein assembly factor 3
MFCNMTSNAVNNYLNNTVNQNSLSNVLTKAIGLHGQWGMSSAFDFLEIYDKVTSNKVTSEFKDVGDAPSTKKRLNILLLNPGDIRHILCAISRKRRHFQQKTGVDEGNSSFPEIHFYLMESNTDIMARHLILLGIFFSLDIPIRQKSNTFLEVYGNLKIQKRTKLLLQNLTKELISIINHSSSSSSSSSTSASSSASASSLSVLFHSFLSLDLLSFRDNDNLLNSFKLYITPSFSYKIDEFYNTRMRALLEDRYDSRSAVYDWDYHANYKKTASIIHIKQYRQWRENGIAYEFGDQVYNEPNMTFVAYTEGVMKKGEKKGEKLEVSCDFLLILTLLFFVYVILIGFLFSRLLSSVYTCLVTTVFPDLFPLTFVSSIFLGSRILE